MLFFYYLFFSFFFFFFSSRRRHTRCSRDWSSDVCSSDLQDPEVEIGIAGADESAEMRREARSERPRESHGRKRVDDRACQTARPDRPRSEERRVGKECRSRWAPYQ